MNLNGQDWDSVVIRKKAPTAKDAKSATAVNQAIRAGAQVETLKKFDAGSNKHGAGPIKHATKLEQETEVFEHEHVSTELKKQIQQARIAKKLTQAQLAQLINEKPQIINEYENGKAIPNPQILSKMSRVLGVTLRKNPGKKAGDSKGEGYLTPPLQVTKLEALTGEERMPAPLWSTFCGTSNGLWVGTTAAYNPYTGDAEPVSVDSKGAKVLQQGTCVVEQRVQLDGRDCILRHRAHTDDEEAFHVALHQASSLQFTTTDSNSTSSTVGSGGSGSPAGQQASSSDSSVSGVRWVEEVLERGQEGLCIFDGGSYTSGPVTVGFASASPLLHSSTAEHVVPEALHASMLPAGSTTSAGFTGGHSGDDGEAGEEGPDEEWDEEYEEALGVEEGGGESEEDLADTEPPPELEGSVADRVTTVSEWCLQSGSEHRVRLQLTLSTAGGLDGCELDVEVLRVALAREQWEGLPGTYCPNAAQQAAMSLAGPPGPRLSQRDLTGEWRVFAIDSITVEDVSMETGLLTRMPFYSTQESRQRVQRSGQQKRSGSSGDDEVDEVDGAVLWLPHGVGLTLRMTWPDEISGEGRPKAEDGHANGNGSRPTAAALPGLAVGVTWAPEYGTVLTMTRHYSEQGDLQRVTYSTAVRA
ncbi:hypothetical protein N2152v2_000255 [Parachlorella kessleri]